MTRRLDEQQHVRRWMLMDDLPRDLRLKRLGAGVQHGLHWKLKLGAQPHDHRWMLMLVELGQRGHHWRLIESAQRGLPMKRSVERAQHVHRWTPIEPRPVVILKTHWLLELDRHHRTKREPRLVGKRHHWIPLLVRL